MGFRFRKPSLRRVSFYKYIEPLTGIYFQKTARRHFCRTTNIEPLTWFRGDKISNCDVLIHTVHHSYLSAMIGSTLVARRAGT